MANYRAVASGNWSSGATWGGGAVPPNGEGHNIYSNGFSVTIDQDVNVALITNASVTASFVGGGTSAAVNGTFILSNNVTLVSDIRRGTGNIQVVSTSVTSSSSIVGSILADTSGGSADNLFTVLHNSNGTLNFTGNITGGNAGNSYRGLHNSGSGIVNVVGNVTAGLGGNNGNSFNSHGILNAGILNVTGNVSGTPSSGSNGNIGIISTGTLSVVGTVTGGVPVNASFPSYGISASGTSLSITGNIVAANQNPAVLSSCSTTTIAGSFISSINGTTPISCLRYLVNPAPLNARTRYAANGTGTYLDMFTADNNLGQAAPSDVRVGVSYASGNLTGTLTVPVRGTIANGVTYGPSMPFTASRSGTTATATLAYSYPYVVGDVITVTGASNNEWNGDYTIATVVSGTSVTFAVPSSISASAGTGARMQTKGTATLDGASIAAAIWNTATSNLTTAGSIGERLKNSATVDTVGQQLAAALTAP